MKAPPHQQTAPHAELTAVRRGVFVVTSAQAQNAESCPVVRRVSVGSAEGNGLVIADPTVSRVHAELIPSDRGLWVRDLGSRNGTYLDAIRIKEAEWQPGVRS